MIAWGALSFLWTAIRDLWQHRPRKKPPSDPLVFYDPTVPPSKAFEIIQRKMACFYHLQVTNPCPSRLTGCQGILEHVVEVGRGNRISKPLILKWAHEADYGKRDLEPDQTRKLDLLFVYQGFKEMVFFCQPDPVPTNTGFVFGPGSFHVMIRIIHDAGSVKQWFAVEHLGAWDQVSIKASTES